MKRQTQFKLVAFFVIIIFSLGYISSSVGVAPDSSFEWKIKAGDSNTYVYTRYITSNGQEIENVTIQKGTTVKVDIIDVSNNEHDNFSIIYQITYNDNVTCDEVIYEYPFNFDSSFYVSLTVNNETFWKNLADALDRWTLEGNIVKLDQETELGTSITQKLSIARYWRTGWLKYYQYQFYQDNKLVEDLKIEEDSDLAELGDTSGVPSFEIATFVSAIFLKAAVRKRKKNKLPKLKL